MAKSATHKGCCQICGQEQKLPGGRLSKHGYTVRWGFFAGTCPGSGHEPFEQSKHLIEGAIVSAIKRIEDLSANAAQLQLPATEPQATCRVYRDRAQCTFGEKPGYASASGRIERRAPRQGQRFVVIAQDGREYYIHSVGYQDTELDVATHHNRQHAKELLQRAEQLRAYVDWQRDRIKDWEPQPLRPL